MKAQGMIFKIQDDHQKVTLTMSPLFASPNFEYVIWSCDQKIAFMLFDWDEIQWDTNKNSAHRIIGYVLCSFLIMILANS